MRPAALLVVLALLAPPLAAEEAQPASDMTLAEDCLSTAADDVARRACVMLAANACMATDAGSSNVGMGYCIGTEADWWERRRDALAGRLADIARANDAALAGAGSSAPPVEPLGADAEAAWLAWREAECTYEGGFWGGGSGTGVAVATCRLVLTAERVLRLETLISSYGP